jgi:hypothetical protein
MHAVFAGSLLVWQVLKCRRGIYPPDVQPKHTTCFTVLCCPVLVDAALQK